jgi:hypothetical protein
MSYFADLTPHTYTGSTKGRTVLNVGWLDRAYSFETGDVPDEVIKVLRLFCEMPMHLLRGVHMCQFWRDHQRSTAGGNGKWKDSCCRYRCHLVLSTDTDSALR